MLLALLASGLLVSQARKETASQQSPNVVGEHSVQSGASPTSPMATDEKEFLRGQLAEMRDYDQRLLATVYWSLGGVFLVIVVIAGLNWFANYRIYERERESLRNEINLQVRILQSELEQRFLKLSESLVAAGQKQNDELRHQLVIQVRKSIEAENQRLHDEINSLQRRLTSALYEETAFRAAYYDSLNDGYHAFEAWVDHLEHMKSRGLASDGSRVADVLHKLMRIVEKGHTFSYRFQARLTGLLEDAPPVLSEDIKRLTSLMNSAKKV